MTSIFFCFNDYKIIFDEQSLLMKTIYIKIFFFISFSKSCFGLADFACINYLRDTNSLTYCVIFQDVSSGIPISWNWDFGNGLNSTLRDPVSCFSYPGVYTIRLEVCYSNGFIDSVSHDLYVDVNTINCDYTAGFMDLAGGILNNYTFDNRNLLIEMNEFHHESNVMLYNLYGEVIQVASYFNVRLIHMQFPFVDSGIYFIC